MEQSFGIINDFLARDGRTQARDLSMTTYMVVPFAQSTGTIQCVPNTNPLVSWLVPAHARYEYASFYPIR